MLPFLLAGVSDRVTRSKLETLYSTYGHKMYRIAYSILRDHHLAEDAVQLAFEKIIKHLPKINSNECKETRGLLVIIIRNTSIDLYRQRKDAKVQPLEELEEAASNEESIDDQVIKAEMFAEAVEKLKSLPPQYADIIALRYFYHYSDQELADLLGISVNNVWVRMHRAKQSLIKALLEAEEV